MAAAEKKLRQYAADTSEIVIPEQNLGQYAIVIERLFPDMEVRRIIVSTANRSHPIR
jgi:hypothetical protein